MSLKKDLKEVPSREVSSDDGHDEAKIARKKDHEMVKGIFRFHELPGGEMGFVFKKYFGDKIEKYSMKDGEVYTVPRMVARHLNTNCAYPSYDYKNDEQGRPVMSIAEKIRRCSFQSLDFIDMDEVQTNELPTSGLPRAI